MAIHATITGNLTRDAEEVTLGQAQALKFTIASSRGKKNKEGQRETDFVECVMWRTGMKAYLVKGRRYTVGGELEARPWTGNDCKVKAGLILSVDWIEFGNNADQNGQQTAQNGLQSNDAAMVGNHTAAPQKSQQANSQTDYSDSLPF